LISSAENDEPLPLAELVLPFALYDEDEADSEFCTDCKNCCRMSLAVLVLLVELVLPVLSVEDELSVGGGPP
jgi:hypothetical protein